MSVTSTKQGRQSLKGFYPLRRSQVQAGEDLKAAARRRRLLSLKIGSLQHKDKEERAGS